MKSKKTFPSTFYWGASTASHQVEGGTHNQWSEWEKRHAKKLAKKAEKLYSFLPNWDQIKDQAEDPTNYISGNGVDHYHRYIEDFMLLKKLNMNAFRFGIEWSRIEPKEGKWDQSEIDHYRKYIKKLREMKITPFPTLWHWTEPMWFSKKGAFEKTENIRFFTRFVNKIVDEFGDDFEYLITLNEPNVYAGIGYLVGIFPPNRKNPIKTYQVYRNLAVAHIKAFEIIKSNKSHINVGVAMGLINARAKHPKNALSRMSASASEFLWNWWWLDRLGPRQDFVGVNHYTTDYFNKIMRRKNPSNPLSDVGWYMEPSGISELLEKTWRRYKKPLIITENGLADSKDELRKWWIEETLGAMESAIEKGVDLRGYLHWSLLDNFEWEKGWWPKFGLVEVDRENEMKRTIRPSAKWFARQINEIS